MGLLSVYWDIKDEGHIDIQEWLKSMESTPFRKAIFERLRTHPNIKEFDVRQKIFEKASVLYERLSNFSHTKGYWYSSRKLNDHSNVNHFTEASFLQWLRLAREVVEMVAIFHILKYPVALQETPIDNKFGLNGPMGGFLNPYQVERIREFVSKGLLCHLQEISDHDPDAVAMAEWVKGRPDITDQEFASQIEEQDKNSIAMEGFEHWLKNQKKFHRQLEKRAPDEWGKQIEYFKRMRAWAKENACLKCPAKDFFRNKITGREGA
jgi:hypothetical protein